MAVFLSDILALRCMSLLSARKISGLSFANEEKAPGCCAATTSKASKFGKLDRLIIDPRECELMPADRGRGKKKGRPWPPFDECFFLYSSIRTARGRRC